MDNLIMDQRSLYVISLDPYRLPKSLGFSLREYVKLIKKGIIKENGSMKINMIKDFNKFFEVVDQCKGKVSVVSPEGDNIVLNSKLCRFVLAALAEKKDAILDDLELKCDNPEDVALFVNFLINEV